jgi:hypothetical protein
MEGVCVGMKGRFRRYSSQLSLELTPPDVPSAQYYFKLEKLTTRERERGIGIVMSGRQ